MICLELVIWGQFHQRFSPRHLAPSTPGNLQCAFSAHWPLSCLLCQHTLIFMRKILIWFLLFSVTNIQTVN